MEELDTSTDNSTVGHQTDEQNTNVTLSESQYQQLRDDLKSEVVAEVKAELHDELTSLTGEQNEVEVRSEEDNPGLDDIWIAGNPVGTLLDKALQNSSEAKELVESGGSSGSKGGVNASETTPQNDETALERIADDDEDNPTGVKITSSVDRAAEVMKHWKEWSKKGKSGRNIRDGLRELIGTATGETLVWKQVYRACKKVEHLTKGKIVFTKTDRHGWILLQTDERVSSAGTGG